jgi:WD40 repeat protein
VGYASEYNIAAHCAEVTSKNTRGRAELRRVRSDGSAEVFTEFVASEQRVFLGTATGALRVIDVRSPRSEVVYDGHNGRITAMCLSASDERVFTGGVDCMIRSYDVRQVTSTRSRSNSTLIRTKSMRAAYGGHTDAVIEIAFHDEIVYSTSLDRSVRVWRDVNGRARCLMIISIARDLRSFRLALSTGLIFLYTAQARSVLALDEASGRTIHKLSGHDGGVRHVVVCATGAGRGQDCV